MSQLNLRPILSSDDNASLIDKLNFNFSQISVNGGGPRGKDGLIGTPGYPGPIGPQGYTGPDGATGTYTFTGTDSPNDIYDLDPVPRVDDLYLQVKPDGIITMWKKEGTGTTGWNTVSVIDTTTEQFVITYGGEDEQAKKALMPNPDLAQRFLVSDIVASTTEGMIFEDLLTRQFANFIQPSPSNQWLSVFANQGNQIRLVNTDTSQITPDNATDKLGKFAGVYMSLQSSIIDGNSDNLLVVLKDAANPAYQEPNKFFAIKLNTDSGDTASFYTDNENKAAIGAVIGDDLYEKFTVFGTAAVDNHVTFSSLTGYDLSVSQNQLIAGSDALLRIDGTTSGSSKMRMSIGSYEGSATRDFLTSIDYSSDRQIMSAVIGSRSGYLGSWTLAAGPGTGTTITKFSVGNIDSVSEFEVGTSTQNRLAYGRLDNDPIPGKLSSYIGLNARRNESSATWYFDSTGTDNGGAVLWNSSAYSTMGINVHANTGNSQATESGNTWVKPTSALFKKGTVSGDTVKLLLNSSTHSTLNANQFPDITVGMQSSVYRFNFNASSGKGIGLGYANPIEWFGAEGPDVTKASGFRMNNSEQPDHSLLKFQVRTTEDSSWFDAMKIIGGRTTKNLPYHGSVLIGGYDSGASTGDLILPDSLLRIQGHGGSAPANLQTQNLLRLVTGSGTESFVVSAGGQLGVGIDPIDTSIPVSILGPAETYSTKPALAFVTTVDASGASGVSGSSYASIDVITESDLANVSLAINTFNSSTGSMPVLKLNSNRKVETASSLTVGGIGAPSYGTLSVNGSAYIETTLTTEDALYVNAGGAHISGNSGIEGDVSIEGTLQTTGKLTIDNDAYISGDEDLDGMLTVGNGIYVSGGTGVETDGPLTVNNTAQVNNYLYGAGLATSSTGTISIMSSTVTGTGTNFLDFQLGDTLHFAYLGTNYSTTIISITSDTILGISAAYGFTPDSWYITRNSPRYSMKMHGILEPHGLNTQLGRASNPYGFMHAKTINIAAGGETLTYTRPQHKGAGTSASQTISMSPNKWTSIYHTTNHAVPIVFTYIGRLKQVVTMSIYHASEWSLSPMVHWVLTDASGNIVTDDIDSPSSIDTAPGSTTRIVKNLSALISTPGTYKLGLRIYGANVGTTYSAKFDIATGTPYLYQEQNISKISDSGIVLANSNQGFFTTLRNGEYEQVTTIAGKIILPSLPLCLSNDDAIAIGLVNNQVYRNSDGALFVCINE